MVAAIHGLALGGGLEVALGCHYRVIEGEEKRGEKTRYGLLWGCYGVLCVCDADFPPLILCVCVGIRIVRG